MIHASRASALPACLAQSLAGDPAGVFAGLGDLPGMAHVRTDIPTCSLPVVVRPGLPLPHEPEPLADLDDRKVLRHPPSRLAVPLPQSLEFSRSLGERQAKVGAVKRKAEEGVQYTRAFQALDMVMDDLSNLYALVKGMALGADALGLDTAESVGRNLARRLDGPAMTDAERDTVLDAVMDVALRQPDSADALAAMLRGVGHAVTGTLSAFDLPLVDAAFERAAARSLDSVMNDPDVPPRRSAFQQRRGPMGVMVSWLMNTGKPAENMQWLAVKAMRRVARSPLNDLSGDDLTRASIVLQSFRYSMARALGHADVCEALVAAVASHVAGSRRNPHILGQALARLFLTEGQALREATHLTSLARQPDLGDRHFGYLAWGLLAAFLPDPPSQPPPPPPVATSLAPADGKAILAKAGGTMAAAPEPRGSPSPGILAMERLVSLFGLLAPRHLGRAVHALALATGDAKHWGPSGPGQPGDIAGVVLAACETAGDAWRIAMVASLKFAMHRLAQVNAAYRAESVQLDARSAKLLGRTEQGLSSIRVGLDLAAQPSLVLAHPGLSTRHRVELLDLALNSGAGQSKAVVSSLADRLLAHGVDEGLRPLALGRLVSRALPGVAQSLRPHIRSHLAAYVERLDHAAIQALKQGRVDARQKLLADAVEARRWLDLLDAVAAPLDGKSSSAQAGVR